MPFKAKALNLDLVIDLTEYIPESEGGILKTDRTDAESINTWIELASKEGSELIKLSKNADSTHEVGLRGKQAVINQIDFFYGKGADFYKKVPLSVLNEIVGYLNEQIHPAKKKSKN